MVDKGSVLCLILKLSDNDVVKGAFSKSSRRGFCNREIKNGDKDQRALEIMTELWNDLSFSPVIKELPNLCSDFSVLKVISFDKMSGIA